MNFFFRDNAGPFGFQSFFFLNAGCLGMLSGSDGGNFTLLFLLGFENSRRNVSEALGTENANAKFDDVIDDFRAIAARGAASVVLWLTDQLPKVINLPDETVE